MKKYLEEIVKDKIIEDLQEVFNIKKETAEEIATEEFAHRLSEVMWKAYDDELHRIITVENQTKKETAIKEESCLTCKEYQADSKDEYMTCKLVGYIEWNTNMSADKFKCNQYEKRR